MSETKYRVAEGAPGVSLGRRVYGPGDVLPELTEEQREQLLKTGAIEEASAKDLAEAEQKDAELSEKDADDPDKRADKTTTGGISVSQQSAPASTGTTTTTSGPSGASAEGDKPAAAVTSAPSSKTTGTTKK